VCVCVMILLLCSNKIIIAGSVSRMSPRGVSVLEESLIGPPREVSLLLSLLILLSANFICIDSATFTPRSPPLFSSSIYRPVPQRPKTRFIRLATRTESPCASKKCLLSSRQGNRGKPRKSSSLRRTEGAHHEASYADATSVAHR
jgi:hypothetical protein